MEEIKFEAAISELETIVRRLEDGTGTLDGALADFERAVSLVKICNEQLTRVEEKFTLLSSGKEENA